MSDFDASSAPLPDRHALLRFASDSLLSMGLTFLLAGGCAAPQAKEASCPCAANSATAPVASAPSTADPTIIRTAPPSSQPSAGGCADPPVLVWASQLTPDEVRLWMTEHGLTPPNDLPRCHHRLRGTVAAEDALLCSVEEILGKPEDGYRVTKIQILKPSQGHLESVWAAPLTVDKVPSATCANPEAGPRLVEIQLPLVVDDRKIVLRDHPDHPCSLSLMETREDQGFAPEVATARTKLVAMVCDARGVYEWKNGTVSVSQDGVVVAWQPTKPAEHTLPGACVDPRTFALKGRLKTNLEDPYYDPIALDLDLDGDNDKDVVIDGGAARWQTSYMLFVKRGSCSHYVGSIPASEEPAALTTKSKGLFDLHTADDECPIAKSRFCDTIWRFDGKKYVRFAEQATTRCPDAIQP